MRGVADNPVRPRRLIRQWKSFRPDPLAAAELENETDPPSWNRQLTLELLRAEAEALMGPVEEEEERKLPPPPPQATRTENG
jgi:hypothetical protein